MRATWRATSGPMRWTTSRRRASTATSRSTRTGQDPSTPYPRMMSPHRLREGASAYWPNVGLCLGLGLGYCNLGLGLTWDIYKKTVSNNLQCKSSSRRPEYSAPRKSRARSVVQERPLNPPPSLNTSYPRQKYLVLKLWHPRKRQSESWDPPMLPYPYRNTSSPLTLVMRKIGL